MKLYRITYDSGLQIEIIQRPTIELVREMPKEEKIEIERIG